MTKVVFYKSNGVIYGFDEQGHTGYADAGEDILCAAISSMTMLVINTVRVSYEADATCTVDEEHAHIELLAPSALPGRSDERKEYAIRGLIMAYYEQLKELETDYPGHIKVSVVEKTIE